MPVWTSNILVNFVPTLLIALVSARITVHYAIKQFYKERWWEQKRQTYARLFEALHHFKRYADEKLEVHLSPEVFKGEDMEVLKTDWQKFSREFRLIEDLASFELSRETVKVLDEYRKAKHAAVNRQDIYLWMEADLAAVTQCLEKLKKAAEKDLKVS